MRLEKFLHIVEPHGLMLRQSDIYFGQDESGRFLHG